MCFNTFIFIFPADARYQATKSTEPAGLPPCGRGKTTPTGGCTATPTPSTVRRRRLPARPPPLPFTTSEKSWGSRAVTTPCSTVTWGRTPSTPTTRGHKRDTGSSSPRAAPEEPGPCLETVRLLSTPTLRPSTLPTSKAGFIFVQHLRGFFRQLCHLENCILSTP